MEPKATRAPCCCCVAGGRTKIAGAGAATGDGTTAAVTVVGIVASDTLSKGNEGPPALQPLRPPGAGHVDLGANGRDATGRTDACCCNGAGDSGAGALCSVTPCAPH